MIRFPIFLSLVLVVRNQAPDLPHRLTRASELLAELVSDYELIVVDNASEDDSVAVLRSLTAEGGLPNLQVYALTKQVGSDTASWAGIENALGDFVATIDLDADDLSFLAEMLSRATSGADVVFARNELQAAQGLAFRFAHGMFNYLYQRLNGIHLTKEAPGYRVLSKRVVNFVHQHARPSLAYRHLPATGGFARVNLTYRADISHVTRRRIGESIDQGMQLLVGTARSPMRAVTWLSLFGAGANLLYSAYVVLIALIKRNVAPGWVSLSLQQSGMFFLLSLVLLVLGEYVLRMASLSGGGPEYHVGREFTSAVVTRHQRLNVEENDVLDGRRSAEVSAHLPR